MFVDLVESVESPDECEEKEKEERKKHKGRNPFPAHLPREEIVNDLPEEEKSCGHCGSFLSQIGVEEREQLETVSVQFIVKKHKRLKYACKCCGETVAIAKSPPQAIEKCSAGPNLLAQVLVDKYGDHLPLYRQEQRFERHGIHINRSTLWSWVVRRVALIRNTQLSWARFKAHDLEANALPKFERRRGQEHGYKARNIRKRV